MGTTVNLAAGSPTATQTVSVIDDALVEGSETVILTLAAGTNYVVGSPSSDTFAPATWWTNREQSREVAVEYLRWINTLLLGDRWHAAASGR